VDIGLKKGRQAHLPPVGATGCPLAPIGDTRHSNHLHCLRNNLYQVVPGIAGTVILWLHKPPSHPIALAVVPGIVGTVILQVM